MKSVYEKSIRKVYTKSPKSPKNVYTKGLYLTEKSIRKVYI